jgi:transposase InsO family protein
MLSVWTHRQTLSQSKKHVKRYRDGNTSSTKKKPLTLHSSSIQVPVNHVSTKVLIDTGAAISLIHETSLKLMQHKPIVPCSLKEVHTANSGFISLIGLVKLNVKINYITTSVDAYVTRDLVCPMILGRDWIQNNHVNVNFSTNRIYIHDGITSVPLLPLPRTESLVMSLSHSVSIPPFHEKFISGYVPIKSLDHALFTPNLALQHTRLVLIPHSLLHIRAHRGIISIINTTRHTKTIPRNTPLGFISPLTEEPTMNVIHDSLLNSRYSSSQSVISFSCIHCDNKFSSETTLYEHLLHCCNKASQCTTKIITNLIEHIRDPAQQMKVYLILHQYEQLFDDSCSTGIHCEPQCAINTGSHFPIAEHPRRISPLNRQIINDEVQKMLSKGIISFSNSPWASPVVIVKKRDGSPRFCIDYRRINLITQKDVYPLPRIDDVIERLNGSQIFSKLDLRSGYFQVPLASTERDKTAFITPDGLWQFNRLPQGLKNSPAVFQRLMNQTLGSLRWDVCLAYLDDIIVYSTSFDQHLIDVNKVCQALHTSNFKLNYNKCSFFQNEISFLGHKINAEGCLPTDDNTRSIMQFPVPTSSKAAHSFLQMVGFYRKFIPRFADISAPLNKFTRKGFTFIWTEQEQESFDRLKQAITSPAVLILPDPSQVYTIRTDASRVGIGAVLLQQQTSGRNRESNTPIYKPVAFASRRLKAAEKNYSAIELEALAIWWSVTNKFRSYVEGQQFVLETDHKPLISLMKKPYHNTRIERWMTMLQQYDIIIRHISGRDNTTADALSRYPVDSPAIIEDDEPRFINSSTQTEDIFINVVTTRSMTRQRPSPVHSTTTLQSPISSPIKKSADSPHSSSKPISSITPPSSSIKDIQIFFDHDTLNKHQNADPSIWKIKNTHSLDPKYIIDTHGVLYKLIRRKSGRVIQLRYIPASLISNVLLAFHNSTFNGAHFGIKRTFYKIRDRFYWPHMYNDIQRHILSCINCRKMKPSRRKPDGHLQSIEPPQGIWERLAMDYVGPVPQSKSGNRYFLVLTDLFSKFVVTKPVPDNTSTTAAKFLLHDVFMVYGVPVEIITDNGTHFSSSLYESLLKLAGCCHIKTTPYHPQANGQCERHNATLVPNLVALSNHSRSNWDEKLIPTTFNYNATRHDSTGFTPFELMFGRPPRFMADLASPSSIPSSVHHHHHTMQQFIEHTKIAARQNNLKHQQLAKQRYDQNRSNPQYSVGRAVLIRNRNPTRNKFSSKFIGPYNIINRLNEKTYVVQHGSTDHRAQVTVQDIRSIQ